MKNLYSSVVGRRHVLFRIEHNVPYGCERKQQKFSSKLFVRPDRVCVCVRPLHLSTVNVEGKNSQHKNRTDFYFVSAKYSRLSRKISIHVRRAIQCCRHPAIGADVRGVFKRNVMRFQWLQIEANFQQKNSRKNSAVAIHAFSTHPRIRCTHSLYLYKLLMCVCDQPANARHTHSEHWCGLQFRLKFIQSKYMLCHFCASTQKKEIRSPSENKLLFSIFTFDADAVSIT